MEFYKGPGPCWCFEGRTVGRLLGWSVDRMVVRPDGPSRRSGGRVVGRSSVDRRVGVCRIVGVCGMVGRWDGRSDGRSAGTCRMVGRPDGPSGWSVCKMVGWSLGRMVDRR